MPQQRRQTLNLLRVAMIGAVVAPAVLFAYGSWSSYRAISATADERISRNLDVLAEHTQKVMQSVEVGFTAVDEIFSGLTDEGILARRAEFQQRLNNISNTLREVQSIWIFDRNGRVLVTGAVANPPDLDFSDRDYFRAHVDQDIGIYIGELLIARAGISNPFFSISRRRKSTNSAFEGVVHFSVESRNLSAFYQRIASTAYGSFFSLLRADGMLLARHPGPLETPMRVRADSPFFQQIKEHPEGSIYDTRSLMLDQPIRVGLRKIPEHTLYVTSGIEKAELNRAWLATMGSHLVFGLPATLLLFSVIALALRRSHKLYEEIERREHAESALRQAQRMEAVGNLTGGIAHDFNNLLMVILGNLEIAKKQLGNWTDTSRARLERVIGNANIGAQRAATLTQRLLAFSRRQPLDPKPLDPAKLIAGLSDLLRRPLGATIDLEIVGAGGLWQVEADPAELESAILNLALNARDAMPNGGKLTIETGNTFLDEAYARQGNDIKPGQYVMIAIADTGTGMSKDVTERAFEPFFTTKESGQGTGLGLSQVYGFVKQSGGHVKIYSEPGLGTSVKIYLPRSMAKVETEYQPVIEISGAQGSEKILVVEDDDDVRDYVIETLRELNYNVMGVANADQALAIVANDRFDFDLMLTDVVLPAMNGRELADKIRDKRPNVPVLFMTGYSRNAIVHHGRLDPGVDLLQKPITQEALALRVREMLDARRTRA